MRPCDHGLIATDEAMRRILEHHDDLVAFVGTRADTSDVDGRGQPQLSLRTAVHRMEAARAGLANG